MTRSLIFILGLATATAIPAVASANCGTVQGSFSVTCEQGVQVYRHNALSGIPRGISQAEASVETAEIRARTNRLRIESQERATRRAAQLREREIVQDEFRSRIVNQNIRQFSNSRFGRFGAFGGGFNNSGGFFAQPVRIRSGSLNVHD